MDEATVKDLLSGDQVLISGTIYTGRDAAHKRLIETLEKGEPLPLPIEGQIIFYVGPAPAKPGKPSVQPDRPLLTEWTLIPLNFWNWDWRG